MSRLTKRQAAILDLLMQPFHDGEATEGEFVHYLYPLVLRPRRTVKTLEARGLVQMGGWESEEWGHRVFITAAGRAAASTATRNYSNRAVESNPDEAQQEGPDAR